MLTNSHTVYDILGIDRNADTKTIKKAYAKLVKQYHPEEHPEEWKRIHDAYELAMELASGKKQKPSVLPEHAEQSQKLTESVNNREQKEGLNRPIEMPEQEILIHMLPEEQENELEAVFDDVERLAYEQQSAEEKAGQEKFSSAIKEIQRLTWQKQMQLTEWKSFLEQEDMLPIFSQKKFLRELGDSLTLKKIDDKLYVFLVERLDWIAVYTMTDGMEMTGRNMAAISYVKGKVEAAYRYWQSAQEERQSRIRKWVAAVTVIFVLIFAVWGLGQDEQRKEEKRQKQNIIMEQQNEVMQQQQERQREWMQEMLEENPDVIESMKQDLQQMLEDGAISQKSYDDLMQRYGLDPDDSAEEATED